MPLWSAGLYLLFAIYGSLVPLQFVARPLEEAWTAFRQIRYLELGIASRADWVANILLFVPLAFLWLGVLWPAHGRGRRAVVSGVVWAGCVGLSAAVEFVQLFFPPRTVSLNDVLAETIGATVGVAAWWLIGTRLVVWIEEWRQARGTPALAERVLGVYLAGLVFYSLMPLDLTLSPADLFHKWKEGRVVIVPFGFVARDVLEWAYGTATDALLWMPVAALWVLGGRRSMTGACVATVAVAAVVEFAQLFVYTRISDATDVLAALVGGLIGGWIGSRLRGRIGTPVIREADRPRAVGIALATAALVVWLGVLAAVFWSPFDFRVERGFVLERLPSLWRVPLTSYYYSTEYRALTELLRKTLFFAPLGVIVGLLAARLESRTTRRIVGAITIVASALVAAVIELGKVLVPSRFPDSSNVLLETAAVALAYWLTLALARRLQAGENETRPTTTSVGSVSLRSRPR